MHMHLHKCKSSPDDCHFPIICRAKFHTSLLIPTFDICHNRPVAFWHFKHSKYTSWGYSTTNRLRPGEEHAFEGISATDADQQTGSSTSTTATADNRPLAQKLWEDQHWMKEEYMTGEFPTPYTFGDPERPERQGRAWLQVDGNTLNVFWADFKLWQVVRASTAAPTFFPRK
jgi:hypothetical protein